MTREDRSTTSQDPPNRRQTAWRTTFSKRSFATKSLSTRVCGRISRTHLMRGTPFMNRSQSSMSRTGPKPQTLSCFSSFCSCSPLQLAMTNHWPLHRPDLLETRAPTDEEPLSYLFFLLLFPRHITKSKASKGYWGDQGQWTHRDEDAGRSWIQLLRPGKNVGATVCHL